MHPTMIQQVTTTPATADVLSPDERSAAQLAEIEGLQQRANRLELRLSDLGTKTGQLLEQRQRASTDERPRLNQQLSDVQHDMAATSIELRTLHEKIARLDRTAAPQTAVVVQPPYASSGSLNSEQIMQVGAGAFVLMIPLVLAFTRRVWVRGRPTMQTTDIESSPRLQRMEQAIEAIAVEVERIGEAQRFTTRLLSERQPDALNRSAAVPLPVARREPGTVTPH